MCRIFGFRSVINSQVHHSLVRADNAIALQSEEHPDGWGVAYYLAGAPHLVKSETQAMRDRLFQRVSGVVTSETVVAHIRKATQGENSLLNTHPFQYGQWIFAHNGNLKDFESHRSHLLDLINPSMRRFVLGQTDSEILFYVILSELENQIPLHQVNAPITTLASAIRKALGQITHQIGPFLALDDGPPSETYLTFVLTNGRSMLAHQGGKQLYFSTYKKRCPDRDVCSHFLPQCEAPPSTGHVNHLIFSSEPLSGENIWTAMNPGDLIGVDESMKLHHWGKGDSIHS